MDVNEAWEGIRQNTKASGTKSLDYYEVKQAMV
jgi:hypothetical protein